MKVECPSCNLQGNYSDVRIPEKGKNIACPKCKTSFFIKKEEIDEFVAEEKLEDKVEEETKKEIKAMKKASLKVNPKKSRFLGMSGIDGIIAGITLVGVLGSVGGYFIYQGLNKQEQTENKPNVIIQKDCAGNKEKARQFKNILENQISPKYAELYKNYKKNVILFVESTEGKRKINCNTLRSELYSKLNDLDAAIKPLENLTKYYTKGNSMWDARSALKTISALYKFSIDNLIEACDSNNSSTPGSAGLAAIHIQKLMNYNVEHSQSIKTWFSVLSWKLDEIDNIAATGTRAENGICITKPF